MCLVYGSKKGQTKDTYVNNPGKLNDDRQVSTQNINLAFNCHNKFKNVDFF
jgi:hypothetical protein